jgi:hypothetical protein
VNSAKRRKKISCLFFAFFILLSCASTGSFDAVDSEVEFGRYEGSLSLLEKNKNSRYTPRDTILYYLDKGMLSHYNLQYADSSLLLQEGERAIEDAFTKSIGQEISTYLVNDNSRDYGGEDYEDIYINAFNALNYYHRGEAESSMVEIRRMNNKLQYLAHKYDVALSNLQKKALEDNQAQLPKNTDAPKAFNDSALARYLGMLFYREAGLHDDARIDRDYLLAAFANAPHVYPYPVPQSVSEELDVPSGMARLNVLAFGGLSPIKEENVIRVPLLDLRWIKIALPEMISRPSVISKIELVFDDGDNYGGSHELELLEDIDAVAKQTFLLRQQVIYLKTIIRATVKTASSSALNAAAKQQDGSDSLVLGLFSLAAQVYAEASEQADLRTTRFFPARAYVGGVNLQPGTYDFKINYYDRHGKTIMSVPYKDFIVKKDGLNLVEAVCLK